MFIVSISCVHRRFCELQFLFGEGWVFAYVSCFLPVYEVPLYLFRVTSSAVVFQVTVSDGGTSPKQSSVWVVVQVLDENDNKPQFPEKVYQIKLPERDRKKRGEPIYRAFAFDKDEGPNAEISYSIVDGNDDGKFFIDPKTGMVSSRKQFTAGSYDILTVSAFPSTYKPVIWLTFSLEKGPSVWRVICDCV